MSTHTANYLEAIERLPEGAMLRLEQISWDEYEQLLEEITVRPGLRVTYDQGRVEVMSPTTEHEEYKDFILLLVYVLAEEIGVILETRGSATYKQKRLLKGTEPDCSFYVQNAKTVIGNRRIDINSDPPPDVVVEIDITNESLGKFPIYVAFGVPEIWRYDGERAQIYHLIDQSHAEAARSLAFPSLTAQALTDCIEQSKTEGQSAALAAFRQRVRASIKS
ncbi:MAG TPA: Uma2 family endonuclease [Blastocatellia bacterium]|nr:Uma2 family endonuclease [Blastocatellia bacterium]